MKITIEIYREFPGCSYASDYPVAEIEVDKEEWAAMTSEERELRCEEALLKTIEWWYREKKEIKIEVKYEDWSE